MRLIPAMKAQGIYDTVVVGLDKLTQGRDMTTEDVLTHLSIWSVVTNSRPTRRLGQCNYRKRHIELHACLMKAEHKGERDMTFLHEIAHAVDKKLYDKAGHGPTWKAVMRAFGQRPTRTVQSAALEEHRLKNANYVYACLNCGEEHHLQRRLKRPAYDYKHSKCGGKLYIKSYKKGKAISKGDKMFREQLKKEGKI